MSVRVGIVMDPIASISYKKDSSLAMLLAAQARGWSLFYMEQRDLYQGEGKARARMRPLKVFADPARWYELGEEQEAVARVAFAAIGTNDFSVIPGTVFTSSKKCWPLWSSIMSTRPQPEAPTALKALSAVSCMAAVCSALNGAGHKYSVLLAWYLAS